METNAMTQVQARPITIASLLSDASVKNRFNDLLGQKAAGFISSVLSVSKTPSLAVADPKTILNAAVVAATLDLPINPNLGFAYIVPYNSRKNIEGRWVNVPEAQFQMGYKGFIQLAQRSGLYKTIHATDVREGELISNDLLTGEISIKAVPGREQKEVIGYAAHFELLNGFRKTLYMTKAELEMHANAYSQSYANEKSRAKSLWATQFDVMARKTVIKLLLSKFGPLTIEMQKAHAFDQAVVGNADDENSARYEDNNRYVEPNSGEEVSFEEVKEEPKDSKDDGVQEEGPGF